MSNNNKNYYDDNYYRSHCGDEYERGNGWEQIFGNYADRIVKEIAPKKTLDVGCAKGFFVEALRDRGVEAYGIDISDYAISEVREDIKPFCKVKSALLPIEEKYDLITCIEVLEHLDNKDIPLAVQRLCEATDDIIFSSTPFDYDEESHISIHTPEYWAEQFAYNGFYHDVQYDCSYIAVQTMRFRKVEKSKIDLIREYESVLFEKTQEVAATRHNYQMAEENVKIYKEAYQKHVDMINEELNPKISALIAEQKVIRREVEESCRVQLEDEVCKRKEIEEKYFGTYELLQKNVAGLEVAHKTQMELAQYNRDLISCNMSVVDFLRRKRAFRKNEQKILDKGLEYWKPVFDAEYYAEKNEDVVNAVGTGADALLNHFVRFGSFEGRVSSKEFDVERYMALNPDVAESCRTDKRAAYLHYIEYGISENRKK